MESNSMDKHLDYVCPHCWHSVDECTCEYQPWKLIQIDRNMQPIIRILNEKGYVTEFCCESHDVHGNMYIKFRYKHGFGSDLPAPEGFEIRDKSETISFIYDSKATTEEFEKQKREHLDSLMKWCEELPVAKCVKYWTDMHMV